MPRLRYEQWRDIRRLCTSLPHIARSWAYPGVLSYHRTVTHCSHFHRSDNASSRDPTYGAKASLTKRSLCFTKGLRRIRHLLILWLVTSWLLMHLIYTARYKRRTGTIEISPRFSSRKFTMNFCNKLYRAFYHDLSWRASRELGRPLLKDRRCSLRWPAHKWHWMQMLVATYLTSYFGSSGGVPAFKNKPPRV